MRHPCLLALADQALQTCRDTLAGPLLRHLEPDMLLLWDRGFASYALVQSGAGARRSCWPAGRGTAFCGRCTCCDGSYLRQDLRHDSDRRHDRNGIDVRVIEYACGDGSGSPGAASPPDDVCWITTCIRPKRLVELYHTRWEEEIAIDELKTHQLDALPLRSQTPGGVVQEIYGLMLGHYVVRRAMFEAAAKTGVSPLRISFVGTLSILQLRICQCPREPAATWRLVSAA